jgi:glutamate 5-kinase
MISKLEAAEIAAALGIPCRISNGKQENPILNALDKGAGTFIRAEKRLKARKHWLAYLSRSKGKIVIDAGAEEAVMKKGKSILPKGIIKVEGNFGVGDLIDVLNEKGKCIARGIANYSSSEVDKIKGKSTSDIEKVLGLKRRDEVIYRDNLVILKEEV